MKLAVTGKGGVGKSTVSALLAHALRLSGRRVFAVDADPDSNLAAVMGHPNPGAIRPLVELKDLIEERTGAKPGATGGVFRLNPLVDDVPDKYSVELDGVRVLVIGALKKGGAGCYCPENAFLRALTQHLFLAEDAALVMDMEAGVEHLGRGTVAGVDYLLVVLEPGRRSVETALRIEQMAGDLGLRRIGAVGNKIRSPVEETFLRRALPSMDFVGFLPYDDRVREAEMAGRPVAEASEVLRERIQSAVKLLERAIGQRMPVSYGGL